MFCAYKKGMDNAFRRSTIALAISAFAVGSATHAADITWTGGAGAGSNFWDLATNWSSNPALPGAADNALIGAAFLANHRSGTNTVLSLQASGSFDLTGGTLSLQNDSFVSGLLRMTNGTLGGTGTLSAGSFELTGVSAAMQDAGTTTITGAAALGDGSANTNRLALRTGRVLNLNGASTYQGESISLNNSATINNAGTFTSLGDVRPSATFNNSIFNAGGTPSTFNNSGTYIQNSGAVDTTISVTFNNSGTVNAQSGRVALSGGGTSSGTFTGSAGGIVDFAGGTHTINTGTIAGSGTVRVSGGTTTLANTASYTGTGTLELTGGTLNVQGNAGPPGPGLLRMTNGTLGGTGTLSAGSFELTGVSAAMQDAGTTTITGAAALGDGSANTNRLALRTGRVLNLNGASTYQGESISLNNSATINNAGTFTSLGDVRPSATFNNSIFNAGGTPSTFNNSGTYIQNSGAVDTTISVTFNNSGTVNAQSGRVALSGGGTSSGTFTGSAGGIVDFAGGTHTINTGTIAGSGTVRVSGGTTTLANTASYTGTGTLELTGGTLNVQGNAGPPGPGLLRMTNGTLGGTGTLSAGSFELTGVSAAMQDAGTTTITGAAALGDGSANTNRLALRTGRVLNLNGASTYQGESISLNNSATINNAGTFTSLGDVRPSATFNNSIFNAGGTPSTFNNSGTYIQNSGAVDTTISVTFNNSGELRIDAGNMIFSAPLNLLGNASVLDIAVAGLVNTNLDINAATLLDGTVRLDLAFAPSLGDVITVFTYNSHSGTFDSVQGTGLGAGFTYIPIYNTGNFQVQVAAIPEPETYLMMTIGLCLVVMAKRHTGRRRRSEATHRPA